MSTQMGLDRCLTFINCQLEPSRPVAVARQTHRYYRSITLSRQAGTGAHGIAEKLLELLALQDREKEERCPWAVFDRNLVEKVIEEHHLPNHVARFMREDRILEISDTLDELFGLHPPSSTLVRQTADTMLRLADLGRVILIGRGANVITAKMDDVFHVRLVGSLEARVQRIQEQEQMTERGARDYVHSQDLGRRRFLKKYFGKDIDDPLLYHLVVNTDRISCQQAASLIVHCMGFQLPS
jgi:cytidylate kinase